MHIKYATFHNFGLFDHYEQAFAQGLVGVFGPNGCGKTTMVNGIFAALTNDFTRFAGVKTDQIHDQAGDKEESFVEVSAVHGGQEFDIRRSLRPNKSELKVHGEKAITNANAIETRLQEDLGVNTQLISRYVFVNQWQMFDFLNQKPSERAEAYKRLCRTEKADRIFEACSAMVAANAVDSEVTDNSDELSARIGQASGEAEQLSKARKKQQKHLLNEKSLKSGRAILRRRERHEELLQELNSCEEREPKLRNAVAKCKKALGKASKQLKIAKQDADTLEGPAESARAALKGWTTYEKRRKRKQELEANLKYLRDEQDSRPEPSQPADYASKSRFVKFLTQARSDRAMCKEVIELFEKNKSGKCPTCHQQLGESHMKKLRADMSTAVGVIKDMKPKVEAHEVYEEAHNAWARWKSAWEARIKAIQDELDQLADLKEPTGNKESLESDVAAATTASARKETARTAKESIELKHTSLSQKLTALEGRIEKLTTKITETQVTDDKLVKVQKRMAEHEQATLEIATIDGQLREVNRRIEDARKDLEALKATLRRRKKLKQAMATLSQVRDVFHWSRLPWMVAHGNLIRMEDDVNAALHWFGDPFWVQADDKLSFQVHLPGRTPKRAEAISGGQKGVLAIAFRSGANAVFNVDLGMMFLDEPTAGLDESNVGYFEDALRALASQVRNRRQLVIVTHALALRPAFDQVIEIGGHAA